MRKWNLSACWDKDCAAWCKASHRQDSQIFLGTFLECGIGFLWGGLYPHGLSKSVYWLQSFYVQQYVDGGVVNLVLDQLIIPQLIFFFILITCLLNIVSIDNVRRNSASVTSGSYKVKTKTNSFVTPSLFGLSYMSVVHNLSIPQFSQFF